MSLLIDYNWGSMAITKEEFSLDQHCNQSLLQSLVGSPW